MNKPRLIDANELYKLIEENSYTLVDRINSKDKGMFLVGIKEAIDKSPTAYDIDKVVEQLEDLNRTYVDLANIRCEPYCDGIVEGIEKAIEIVRKSGVK